MFYISLQFRRDSEIWSSMQTIISNAFSNFLMQFVSTIVGHFFFNYTWGFEKNQIRHSMHLFYHCNKLTNKLQCPKWFPCTTACADFSVSCFDSSDVHCNAGTAMTSLLLRLLSERLSAPDVFGILIIPSLTHCVSPPQTRKELEKSTGFFLKWIKNNSVPSRILKRERMSRSWECGQNRTFFTRCAEWSFCKF